MVRKLSPSAQPPSTHSPIVHWVGGIARVRKDPVGRGDKDEHSEATVMLWKAEGGNIHRAQTEAYEGALAVASDVLWDMIEDEKASGEPPPTHVRVASKDLAEEIRKGHPDLSVVCAPTPELWNTFDQCVLGRVDDAPSEEVLHSFVEAGAALFDAQPWASVPSEHAVLAVHGGKRTAKKAALSITGQNGGQRGFKLFADIRAYRRFQTEKAAPAREGEAEHAVPHLAVR